jgi:uncharacterized protein YajQ (UPF0234 family)
MPSFDVVSRTDMAEVDNAVQGASREIDRCLSFLIKGIEVVKIAYEEG